MVGEDADAGADLSLLGSLFAARDPSRLEPTGDLLVTGRSGSGWGPRRGAGDLGLKDCLGVLTSMLPDDELGTHMTNSGYRSLRVPSTSQSSLFSSLDALERGLSALSGCASVRRLTEAESALASGKLSLDSGSGTAWGGNSGRVMCTWSAIAVVAKSGVKRSRSSNTTGPKVLLSGLFDSTTLTIGDTSRLMFRELVPGVLGDEIAVETEIRVKSSRICCHRLSCMPISCSRFARRLRRCCSFAPDCPSRSSSFRSCCWIWSSASRGLSSCTGSGGGCLRGLMGWSSNSGGGGVTMRV